MSVSSSVSSSVSIPISWGSVAFQIGRSRVGNSQEHSHRWMVFVRGAAGQDITPAVSRIVFTLHHTIRDHVREVARPPFQVTETGWGVFEIQIAVHFHAALGCAPLLLAHTLKLFHDQQGVPPERPVLSECFDELVFNDVPAGAPPLRLASAAAAEDAMATEGAEGASSAASSSSSLSSPPPSSSSSLSSSSSSSSADAVAAAHARLRAPPGDAPAYPFQEHLTLFSAEADLAALRGARQWFRERLDEQAERLERREAEAAALRQQCAALGLV